MISAASSSFHLSSRTGITELEFPFQCCTQGRLECYFMAGSSKDRMLFPGLVRAQNERGITGADYRETPKHFGEFLNVYSSNFGRLPGASFAYPRADR